MSGPLLQLDSSELSEFSDTFGICEVIDPSCEGDDAILSDDDTLDVIASLRS